MDQNRNLLSKLSPHLFWDVDRSTVDAVKNKSFIIQRVLEYGFMSDWKVIYALYGISEIANTAVNIKDLDQKSLAFISMLSKIPEEKFLSYTSKQSAPPHWIDK